MALVCQVSPAKRLEQGTVQLGCYPAEVKELKNAFKKQQDLEDLALLKLKCNPASH